MRGDDVVVTARIVSAEVKRLSVGVVFESMTTMRLSISALALLALPALAADVTAPATDRVAEDRATKDDYALDGAGTSGALKLGADGTFSLKITPKNGKKVHPDAPLEVAIVDNALVKAGKAKLSRGDLKDKASKEPEVTTSLRPIKAGTGTIDATVSFFLCTDAWCQRMSDKIQIPIAVSE